MKYVFSILYCSVINFKKKKQGIFPLRKRQKNEWKFFISADLKSWLSIFHQQWNNFKQYISIRLCVSVKKKEKKENVQFKRRWNNAIEKNRFCLQYIAVFIHWKSLKLNLAITLGVCIWHLGNFTSVCLASAEWFRSAWLVRRKTLLVAHPNINSDCYLSGMRPDYISSLPEILNFQPSCTWYRKYLLFPFSLLVNSRWMLWLYLPL